MQLFLLSIKWWFPFKLCCPCWPHHLCVRQIIVLVSSAKLNNDILLAAVCSCERNIDHTRCVPLVSEVIHEYRLLAKKQCCWSLLLSIFWQKTVHIAPPCSKENVLLVLLSLLQNVNQSKPHHLSIKRYCPVAAAQSPHCWRWEGSPRRCPGGVCCCGCQPVRTSTLCCLGGVCRWGTCGRKRRSRRVSPGWREQRGRRWPQYMPPIGRVGRGSGLAERERNKENVFL